MSDFGPRMRMFAGTNGSGKSVLHAGVGDDHGWNFVALPFSSRTDILHRAPDPQREGGAKARQRFGALPFFLLLLGCLLAGCSTLPKAIKTPGAASERGAQREIYVLSHGWHTGLVVSAADLNRTLPPLAIRFPRRTYYEIGWGDAGFYQAQKVTIPLAFQAMFYSSGTVLHVVGISEEPALYFPNSTVRKVPVCGAGYENLLRFVASSFAVNRNGAILAQRHGIYGDSQFYTGIGRYWVFNTCNKWTAKALESAGLDLNPALKLTAASVMKCVDRERGDKGPVRSGLPLGETRAETLRR